MPVNALDTLRGGKLIGSCDLTAVVAVDTPRPVHTDSITRSSPHLAWTSHHSPQSDRTWRLTDPRQLTCEQRLYRAAFSLLTIDLSLYLDREAFHFNFGLY